MNIHQIKLIEQKVPGNQRLYKQTGEFTSTVSRCIVELQSTIVNRRF